MDNEKKAEEVQETPAPAQIVQENDASRAVYEIEVDGYKCRLKRMNRGTMEVALGYIMPGSGQQPRYLKAGEIILNSCWLDGDEEILKNEELLIAASMAAYELVDLKVAKLKKL